MKYAMGFLIAYTVLLSCFTYLMYTGRIASIQQACVERTVPTPVDFLTQIDNASRRQK